jgi:hypothetical protein
MGEDGFVFCGKLVCHVGRDPQVSGGTDALGERRSRIAKFWGLLDGFGAAAGNHHQDYNREQETRDTISEAPMGPFSICCFHFATYALFIEEKQA